jgi:electron-transferring-flavoprotein dehydrogenase
MKILTSSEKSFTIPNFLLPKTVDNHGNYIISLGSLCEWLGKHAEEQGVEVLQGIPGD